MIVKTDGRGMADLFSPGELNRLQTLRTQYHPMCDRFTERELAHLQFFRWLWRASRLVPSAARGTLRTKETWRQQ